MPRSRNGAGDLAVQEGGDGDGDGVDLVEQRPVVVNGARAELLGDGAGLLGSRVGDADQRHSGNRREDPGVVLPQMSDPDDRDSQRLASWLYFLQRSRARPCLPSCWASMNSSRL